MTLKLDLRSHASRNTLRQTRRSWSDAYELTRFPARVERNSADQSLEPKLVQAADLIGQLGDPMYSRKANALYYEFEEIGMNRQLGYSSPADIIDKYPAFYWNSVSMHLAFTRARAFS